MRYQKRPATNKTISISLLIGIPLIIVGIKNRKKLRKQKQEELRKAQEAAALIITKNSEINSEVILEK